MSIKGENVVRLLGRREVSPSSKRPVRRLWGDSTIWSRSCSGHRCETIDVKHALIHWAEADSFKHAVAKYCPLLPAPRSTIAAAFSPAGKILASTHGDHTVKIICCQSGYCLKVLSGHRRTPWVVRFHPKIPELLASGSLDYEVRLWDANTAECVGSRDFNRPIASLAFHAQGDLLAVASGHKLYIWQYKEQGDASTPNIVLRTRRSLRAVHFHPHAAPLLLTAEVNDLDSPDCPMTHATSRGYQQHHFPAFSYQPAFRGQDLNSFVSITQQSVSVPGWFWAGEGQGFPNLLLLQPEASVAHRVSEPSDLQLPEGFEPALQDSVSVHIPESVTVTPMDISPRPSNVNDSPQNAQRRGSTSGLHELLPIGRPGRLSEVDADSIVSRYPSEGVTLASSRRTSSAVIGNDGGAGTHETQPEQRRFIPSFSTPRNDGPCTRTRNTDVLSLGGGVAAEAAASIVNGGEMYPGGSGGRLHLPSLGLAEEAAAQAAITAAELPCTVKLRLWPHDIKRPCALLDPETCRLTIPHAVLCSEMGTHFSPCGRFLAACVACVLPSPDLEGCLQGRSASAETAGTAFVQSPTRHPISAQQIIYELRIYSLEESTFGEVLASRAVRAAHCLTSIQFSPTSGHILLAYGRRHSSLLRGVAVDGTTPIPIYTILEIYRVADLKLVRILPSAEDEVNVACFHPQVGGGLVYGTKEGKLRIMCCDCASGDSDQQRSFDNHLQDASLVSSTPHLFEFERIMQ